MDAEIPINVTICRILLGTAHRTDNNENATFREVLPAYSAEAHGSHKAKGKMLRVVHSRKESEARIKFGEIQICS